MFHYTKIPTRNNSTNNNNNKYVKFEYPGDYQFDSNNGSSLSSNNSQNLNFSFKNEKFKLTISVPHAKLGELFVESFAKAMGGK